MADQIAPGTWWLHSARGSNVYLFEAAEGSLALIDTGFASSAAAVVAEVESVAPGRKLSQILLTHSHPDHAGAAAEIRRLTGASVVAGRGDCRQRADGTWLLDEAAGRAGLTRRIMRRLRHQSLTETPVDTVLTGEAQVLPGLRAVPTPGHTPGSVCFMVESASIAFVGDLTIIHGERLARPLKWANADDGLYLRTLSEFAKAAPTAGCAGHGPPMMTGFGDRLRTLAATPRGARGQGDTRLRMMGRRAKLLGSFAGNMGKRRADR
jgi:glyoxylase-like metal-dependent hydrolase (beta-lactamase superfamily II)